MPDINQQIGAIIQQRGNVGAEVKTMWNGWMTRKQRANTMKSEISELKKICIRAKSNPAVDQTPFVELEQFIADLENQQFVKSLNADTSFALAQIEKLLCRFDRSTINIAVAGVGRCGKSSALKSMIGQAQDDNSTIPSGSGPAVTAGKSVIHCVLTPGEEKTVVRYHTEESFLADLISPLLNAIQLGEYVCTRADDFAELDFLLLREELDAKSRIALDAVKGAEIQLHQSEDKAAAELSLAQTKAYSASFTSHYERLRHLQDIQRHFLNFRMLLTGGSDSVPLSQTSRFVSYPKDASVPAVCYAVREVHIYSRFPNNAVQALQLTDLPGLGTSSQSEKRCFLEGFNYAVDLALMLRRPEGLFQNFTTEADLAVLDVLSSTFGENHLHECMVMFQNDANLPQSDVDSSYQQIIAWNQNRKHPLTVIRGNAFDADFMQSQLLPEILQFMLKNLPKIDQALIDEVLAPVKELERKFDAELLRFEAQLIQQKRYFPNNQGANAISDRARKISVEVMNGVNALMNHYGDDSETRDDDITAAILKQTSELKEWLQREYDPANVTRLRDVENSIHTNLSAIPYANREIHFIRIRISEGYSALEKIHGELIGRMQHCLTGILHRAMPSLFPADGTLDDFIVLAGKSGECRELIGAISDLNHLEVPFYNVLYPDLRRNVFDKVQNLERNFMPRLEINTEKQAKIVISELQNIGMNWLWKAENLLHSQSKINDIISAALERFQDRVLRSDESMREWISFVEFNWGEIQDDDTSYLSDIRTKIEKMLI